ncbi:hypothetical protein FACS189444_0230 [Spirochaetia bacterium]|nr:hypothetical protein FACS189444_0230 [Spirochaetia bacterium]
MNNGIDEQGFYNSWLKICNKSENADRLLSSWDYTTDFTDVVLRSNNSIINQVSEEIDIEVYREYYHLDAIFYNSGDCVHPNPKNKTWGYKTEDWLTRIIIALEHENNLKTAFQEIAHLITTNSKLKVLITYAGKDDKNACAADFGSILVNSDSTPILLIIGSCDKKEGGSYQINWDGYILSKESVTNITASNPPSMAEEDKKNFV